MALVKPASHVYEGSLHRSPPHLCAAPVCCSCVLHGESGRGLSAARTTKKMAHTKATASQPCCYETACEQHRNLYTCVQNDAVNIVSGGTSAGAGVHAFRTCTCTCVSCSVAGGYDNRGRLLVKVTEPAAYAPLDLNTVALDHLDRHSCSG